MAKLSKKQIQQRALQLVALNFAGIRYIDIVNKIKKDDPETPTNTISGAIWNLDVLFPKDVIKPSKGLYFPATSVSATGGVSGGVGNNITVKPPLPIGSTIQELQFYQPLADYLKGELSEVVEAEALGGAGLGRKWGTPDVVGVYKPLASDRIKFDLEIVSAEIKIDAQESVTAFGQAIAYRLFSAKVYVVMPNTIPKEDQNRLEALCMLFGVGLILFDLNPAMPNFNTRVRAQRFAPDMFYVNVFADQLNRHNPRLFQKLF